MGKRTDAVVVYRGVVFVVEYKVGSDTYQKHAIDQVLDYALDLKNFHEGSHQRTIAPVLVATAAPFTPMKVEAWSDGVVRPILANLDSLLACLEGVAKQFAGQDIDIPAWERSPYKPTPTIVEAAQALYQGHDVKEISRSVKKESELIVKDVDAIRKGIKKKGKQVGKFISNRAAPKKTKRK